MDDKPMLNQREPIQEPVGIRVISTLRKNWLSLSIFIALLLGVGLGCILRFAQVDENIVGVFALFGDVFLRGVFMLIAPLIMTSVISGIVGSKNTNLKNVGFMVPAYCISTSTIASVTGMILHFLSVSYLPRELNQTSTNNHSTNIPQNVPVRTILMDILRSPDTSLHGTYCCSPVFDLITIAVKLLRLVVPSCTLSLAVSFYISQITHLSQRNTLLRSTDGIEVETTTEYVDTVNMCGLIFCSIVLGLVINKSQRNVDVVIEFVMQINSVILDVLKHVKHCAPFGVFCLVVATIGSSRSGLVILKGATLVFAINTCGQLFHFLVTLNGIYFIFTRKTPFVYILALKDALFTALATMSSAATFPTTMRCAEKFGIKPAYTRLILPIAATINMDGGAILVTQTCLFLAHVHDIPMTAGKILLVLAMSVITNIGTAAVPGVFFIALVIVLTTTGVPIEFAPLLLGVNFIFEGVRTVTNVYGDCVGVAVIQRLKTK